MSRARPIACCHLLATITPDHSQMVFNTLNAQQIGGIRLKLFLPGSLPDLQSGRAIPVEGYICADCWTDVQFIKPPFANAAVCLYEGEITTGLNAAIVGKWNCIFPSARSAVVAQGVVLEVIHRYKYLRALWFEPFLADLLVRQAKPVLQKQKWDLIVPVPLHRLKKREREFNQAERLSEQLSQATGIAVNRSLLERIEFTRTQTQLTRAQRMSNVRSAFRMRTKQRLNGERIILLDDVLTTGATTSACAKVLQKAGAGEICVWTVARGL